jgi:enamine deaminase RidA (YjgF/YER057c/UK114 family)
MSRIKPVNPESLPRPVGYSHGMLAEGRRILHVAGQIGCDSAGALVSSDIEKQMEKALSNVMAVVETAGGTPASVTRLTIYVTDVLVYRAHLKAIGEAYRRVMGKHYPAMAVIEVKGLFDAGAKVELEATAVL